MSGIPKPDEPIHAEIWWGEGSDERRDAVEAFYRTPEGQECLRTMLDSVAENEQAASADTGEQVRSEASHFQPLPPQGEDTMSNGTPWTPADTALRRFLALVWANVLALTPRYFFGAGWQVITLDDRYEDGRREWSVYLGRRNEHVLIARVDS